MFVPAVCKQTPRLSRPAASALCTLDTINSIHQRISIGSFVPIFSFRPVATVGTTTMMDGILSVVG